MEENNNSIPTDPETGEVIWSDETLAWFDKWELHEE